jgi:hypothetical protein
MPQNDNTVRENAVDEKVQCFTAKFESLHQAFGTSEVSINCFVILARSRMQTSGKVSLQLLVE